MSQKLLDNARITYETTRSDYSQKSLNVQVSEQNLLSNNQQKLAKQASLESLMQVKNFRKELLNILRSERQ